MTREEAVKMLQATRLMLTDGANQPISDLYYALDMAIEALEQIEKCSEKPNNLERLQACIDCEHTDMCEWCYTRWSKEYLRGYKQGIEDEINKHHVGR